MKLQITYVQLEIPFKYIIKLLHNFLFSLTFIGRKRNHVDAHKCSIYQIKHVCFAVGGKAECVEKEF